MRTVRAGQDHYFPKLDLPFVGQVALGNGTQWLFHIETYRQGVYVAILQTSYRWGESLRLIDAEQPIRTDTLRKRFPKMLDGDAGNIADLLNDQRDAPPEERQGYYHSNLLREEAQP